jgi:hydrogenase maturation factor HypF (carbamoyltransferase family)
MAKIKLCKWCNKEISSNFVLQSTCSPKCYDKYIEQKAKDKKKIAKLKKSVSVTVLKTKLWKITI